MNCQECQQQFEAMLTNALESSARAEAETHLRDCVRCSREFADTRKLWALLGRAPEREPSHGFADRVLRQLDGEPRSAAVGWRAWPVSLRWGIATAAVVVVVSLSSWAAYQRHQEDRRFAHFEELFNVAQNVDPETVINAAAFENGDAL